MNFRTEVKIEQLKPWTHQDNIMCLGSCFAENMGGRLQGFLFDTYINPFGITFNPLSLASQLKSLQSDDSISMSEIQEGQDRYFHYQFHSLFANKTAEETLMTLNKSLSEGKENLTKANKLILTFGSAYYYEHNQLGLVNNCHKQPQQKFTKKRASVEEMLIALKEPLQTWLQANEAREVVITVSPVRHWKDGVVENNRSKASLLLLAEELIKLDDRIIYFPSYEIVMDELRDYRFYAKDMLHVSDQATDYVWGKFVNQRLYNQTTLMEAIKQIIDGAKHRPFDLSSSSHQKFVKSMLAKIEKLNFSNNTELEKLRAYFISQLNN
jgi:hypothetical protein